MKQTKLYLIIFLIFIGTNLISQKLDTIVYGGLTLITDTLIQQSNPCLIVDTIAFYHGCAGDYHETIEMVYKAIPIDICDSINDLSKSDKYDYINNNLKKKWETAPTSTLIRDKYFTDRSIYYSPEILFSIQIDNKEYYFDSFKTNYVLSIEKLPYSIFLKERIPNAFSYYGKTDLEFSFIGQETKKIKANERYSLHYKEIKQSMKENINMVEITISNNCRDTLWMQFQIEK